VWWCIAPPRRRLNSIEVREQRDESRRAGVGIKAHGLDPHPREAPPPPWPRPSRTQIARQVNKAMGRTSARRKCGPAAPHPHRAFFTVVARLACGGNDEPRGHRAMPSKAAHRGQASHKGRRVRASSQHDHERNEQHAGESRICPAQAEVLIRPPSGQIGPRSAPGSTCTRPSLDEMLARATSSLALDQLPLRTAAAAEALQRHAVEGPESIRQRGRPGLGLAVSYAPLKPQLERIGRLICSRLSVTKVHDVVEAGAVKLVPVLLDIADVGVHTGSPADALGDPDPKLG